jgi:hypothetical protein
MRRPASLFGLSLVATAFVVASACSDQGEGQRCDRNNNDADCSPGFVCLPTASLTGLKAPTGSAICCPGPGGPAPTVDACRSKSVFDGGAAVATGGASGTSSTGGASGKLDAGHDGR